MSDGLKIPGQAIEAATAEVVSEAGKIIIAKASRYIQSFLDVGIAARESKARQINKINDTTTEIEVE